MALPPFIGRVSNAVGAVADIPLERLVELLDSVAVRVQFADSAAQNEASIAGAHLLANLLARLYPTLQFTGDSALVAECSELVVDINPNADVLPARTSRVEGPSIRYGSVGDEPQAVSVTAAGWSVFIDEAPSFSEPPNAFAALVAACCGAADLFRTVFSSNLGRRGRLGRQPGSFDLVTLTSGRPTASADVAGVDVGTLHLAGAGAIGEACLLALAASGTCGTVTVVDPEQVELSNLQRYVLATMNDLGVAKVHLAAQALAGTGWTVVPVPTVWGADARSSPQQGTVLVALDSAQARLGVAGGVHDRVYNAFTQPADIGWSRHELFGSEPCLACLYYPDYVRPSEDEVVAAALRQPRLRILGYFATNAPVGSPLPVVNPIAEMPVPPEATRWLTVSLLDDLVGAGVVSKAEAADWASRTIGQLYTDGLCGGGIVSLGAQIEDHAVVPLAHQSALAGVMLALMPVLTAIPEVGSLRPDAIEGRVDLNAGWPQVIPRPRLRTPNCICSDGAYVAAWNPPDASRTGGP